MSYFCFWVVDADRYICIQQRLSEQEPLLLEKPLPLKKEEGKYITSHPVGYARKDVFSPGTITAALTPALSSKVGGGDGSGGDTVEVIPMST